MKRGEPLKSNPETTRAWKRRSAEKAAQNRPVRSPLVRSAPESRRAAPKPVRGRLAVAPETPSPRSEPTSLSRADRKRAAAAAERRSKKAVRERSGGRCEVRVRGVCRGRATNYHHRQPRQMGGSLSDAVTQAENFLHICGSGTTGCHGYIESHRDEARRRGWLVPRPTDPAAVPWLPHDEETP